MRHAEDVIIKPIMTEKSYSEIANGKYTFEVSLNLGLTSYIPTITAFICSFTFSFIVSNDTLLI